MNLIIQPDRLLPPTFASIGHLQKIQTVFLPRFTGLPVVAALLELRF